jgi:hypothetical protein
MLTERDGITAAMSIHIALFMPICALLYVTFVEHWLFINNQEDIYTF